MKCPNCGHWNRETFPRCFKCGAQLTGGEADLSWTRGFQARKAPNLVTRFDDPNAGYEHETARPPLAAEMNELKQRRARGEAKLAGMRQAAAERGMVPAGQSGPIAARGAGYVYEPDGWSLSATRSALALDENGEPYAADEPRHGMIVEEIAPLSELDERRERELSAYPSEAFTESRAAKRLPADSQPVVKPSHFPRRAQRDPPRPDVTEALSSRARTTQRAAFESEFLEEEPFAPLIPRVIDLDVPPAETETHAIAIMETRPIKHAPMRGAFAAAVWLLRLLIACAVAAIGFLIATQFIIPQLRASGAQDIPYIIEQAIVQDQPGHIIRIPSAEGDKIVIRELAHTYTVVNGYATISVPDYRFYDDIPNLTAEKLTVTLTPSLEGTKPMPPITFDVDIPLSPVTRVLPKSEWSQVSTAVGTIQLNVTPGSKVVVNGRDWSDAMDDEGTLTVAQPVAAIGDNVVSISVTAPHSRTNSITVTFYRAKMEISLELKEDTGSRSSVSNKNVSTPAKDSENYFLINAITQAGATVTIETPYKNANFSQLNESGAFSFMPIFDKMGDNVIRIRASSPGKEDSVLEHTVYYMPPASEYSRKAWALNPSDYRELLANIERRMGQIYLCQGRVIRVVSESPQLVIMDTGKNGNEQLVMLENKTLDTWEAGSVYKVYADVSGIYDTMPRFLARYSYPQ